MPNLEVGRGRHFLIAGRNGESQNEYRIEGTFAGIGLMYTSFLSSSVAPELGPRYVHHWLNFPSELTEDIVQMNGLEFQLGLHIYLRPSGD